MAKYDPLTAHLAAVSAQDARVEMRFGDVERLVGSLPASARTYRPWWGNSSHVQARAWRAAGWHVDEVRLAEERVVFARGVVGGSNAARRAGQQLGPLATPDIEPPDESDGAPVEIAADLIVLVEPLGAWSTWLPFDEAVQGDTRPHRLLVNCALRLDGSVRNGCARRAAEPGAAGGRLRHG